MKVKKILKRKNNPKIMKRNDYFIENLNYNEWQPRVNWTKCNLKLSKTTCKKEQKINDM